MMLPKAFILTNGLLDTKNAKTAHGLIRGTERYQIAGVIDQKNAGKDAGEVLDGKKRNIPVFASIEEALQKVGKVDACIVGVATMGGVFPGDMLELVKKCIQTGLSVVNGLHDFLNDRPEIVSLAEKHGVSLTDVRRPKSRKELHFWTGEIFEVKVPIIAFLGMDCNLGKRTTTRMIVEALQVKNIRAEMIYTGQTGWMQGGKYGFIFDSTLNDFISGEMEHAIVSCYKEVQPEVILLEGQSSLRNPAGPCGAEFIISGNAKYTVLVHSPKRIYFDNEPYWGKVPSVESEIELIRFYGSEVIALAINTLGLSKEEALVYQKEYEQKLGIPVVLPVEEGVEKVIPPIQKLMNK